MSDVLIDVTTTTQTVALDIATETQEVSIGVFLGGADRLYQGTAGETIEPFRLVYVRPDGLFYKSDVNDLTSADHTIGIALQGTTAGGSLYISLFGVVENPDWNWAINAYLFLNGDGELTQTFDPTSAYFLEVGRAITPTTILLSIQEPIINGTV